MNKTQCTYNFHHRDKEYENQTSINELPYDTNNVPEVESKLSYIITQADSSPPLMGNYFPSTVPGSPEHKDISGFMLPPIDNDMKEKKTLILDLDETLIHSSFQPVPGASIVLPVSFNLILIDSYGRSSSSCICIETSWC